MAEWKLFPLWEPRSDEIKKFSKKERRNMELVIAEQVAGLLSRHGYVSETEVDISDCPDIDEPKTFKTIELEEIPLEDDGSLIIGQVPDTVDGFCTESGVHTIVKEDEYGSRVLSLTVWDPSFELRRYVTDERGKTISRVVLQELFEALSVVVVQQDLEDSGNSPPLVTSAFPAPVMEPEFESLVLQFEK